MKTLVYVTSAALCCGGVWSSRALPAGSNFGALSVQRANQRGAVTDWLTDGATSAHRLAAKRNDSHEEERQEPEDPLEDSDGEPGPGAASLMPVLIVGRLNTSNGAREVGIVNGISDNLYAFRRRVRHHPVAEALAYPSATRWRPPASSNPDPAISLLRPAQQ